MYLHVISKSLDCQAFGLFHGATQRNRINFHN
jgi:hypothetical protein